MSISPKWQEHLERWQQSGLSQAGYCRQAGINPKSLSARWLEHKRDSEEPVTLIPVELTELTREFIASDSDRTEPAKPIVSPMLNLHCRQGHRLELPLSISAAWLAQLLKGLS
jgi:hypothetical protein